jgi:hypothetical protein
MPGTGCRSLKAGAGFNNNQQPLADFLKSDLETGMGVMVGRGDGWQRVARHATAARRAAAASSSSDSDDSSDSATAAIVDAMTAGWVSGLVPAWCSSAQAGSIPLNT